MSGAGLRILAVGARSPVGLNALQTAMCARAQKLEPRGTDFRDRRGARVGLCLSAAVPAQIQGLARLVALAAPALREVCHGLDPDAPLPLVLALPDADRPDADPGVVHLPSILADRSGVNIDAARSRLVRTGHAGGAAALEIAAAMAQGGASGAPASGARGVPPGAILVGGVDSHCHPAVVRWLDDEHRLHSLDTEDGFLPGEGAAFVLLAPPLREGRTPLAAAAPALVGARTGRDEAVAAGGTSTAGALTQLVRGLVEGAGGGPAAWVMNDNNGERHRAKEWSRIAARGLVSPSAEVQPIPELFGDLGAATGPMMTALAWMSFRLGYAPASRALCVLASDGAERGGFLLEQAP